MRVVMTGDHVYPLPRVSSGRRPKAMPSAAGQRIHDWIAKGLGELGHEVLYCLRGQVTGQPPAGVRVTDNLGDGDILHTYAMRNPEVVAAWRERGRPWVESCHIDPKLRGLGPDDTAGNWVFVSRTLAEACGRRRYVLNGVDPSEYVYSETKGDYVLFLSSMDVALAKGLDLALAAAAEAGVPIVVAGTGTTEESVAAAEVLCAVWGATYAGDVQGEEKADLLAGARAVLLPTRLNDACPLVILEALVSGTPVITSDKGACPELVSEDVGIVCRGDEEPESSTPRDRETARPRYRLADAIGRVSVIAPQACRSRAMTDFHYHRMVRDYLREYEAEMAADATAGKVAVEFTNGSFQTSIN